MHKYMKAVGFTKIGGYEEQNKLLQDIVNHYDFKKVVEMEDNRLFAEMSKEYAVDCGVTLFGGYDKRNFFHVDYFFPYFHGSQIITYDQIAIDRHMWSRSYAGACDDVRVGTTLIFHLQNAADYIEARHRDKNSLRALESTVAFGALAESGSVLLPVLQENKKPSPDPSEIERKNSLFNAAQNGDQQALENLTLEDFDSYSVLARRVQHEDVYSIVDNYFMPYGMECDLYNIMGDIIDVVPVKNSCTGEQLYQLGIICNDIPFDVCINARDLVGKPEVGRRFKGIIWLQGRVNF